jgi:hypothetical protein
MRRRRNRRAAWIGLGMAMLAGACTPADSADQNEGEDTGSGRNDVAAASMRPAAALSFGDVGVYGSHWVEYLASEPAAFDFLMYQARVYSQAPGDVAGELSLLSDVGVRLAVVVMFFEHKAQRAAWDGAPALREPEYYEVLFDQLLNETASLDIDAFTMDEENVAQNSEFLSDLYGRVKQRHPERNFYQWYSPTRKPNLAIPGKTRPAALITGITGQDGAYLAEFLLEKGYEVHGIKRRSSLFNTARIDHLYEDPHVSDRAFILHYGDLTDTTNLIRIIQEVQPDEIYNLGAQSHVAVSFEAPEYTANADAHRHAAAAGGHPHPRAEKKTRFYQASTSELYGLVQETPQRERRPSTRARPMPWPSSTPTGSP